MQSKIIVLLAALLLTNILLAQDSLNVTMVGRCDTIDKAHGVAFSTPYAYVASGYDGLRIIDVSTPEYAEVGTYDTPGRAFKVCLSGSYAYVADGYNGLRVINVSDPTVPYETGWCSTGTQALNVCVSGAYAYVIDARHLVIVSISNPASPYVMSAYDLNDYIQGVYVSGSYAYVGAGFSGLKILNVANPSAPYVAGTYDTDEQALGVYVSGSYAYVANKHDGLLVVDISNPSAPALLGSCDTRDEASAVYLAGSEIYVADGDSGLSIIDVSDPSDPVKVGFYNPGLGHAVDVCVDVSFAFMADKKEGFYILNASYFLGVADKLSEVDEVQIEIWPNPFSGIMNCWLPIDKLAHDANIMIFDTKGNIIASDIVTENFAWQPDASVRSGVYIIRAQDGAETTSARVVYIR